MQEEYRSEVQDSPQQTPDSGIEQYGTKPQEDHNNQQGTAAADKWWEQVAVWTWAHRDISMLDPAGT